MINWQCNKCGRCCKSSIIISELDLYRIFKKPASILIQDYSNVIYPRRQNVIHYFDPNRQQSLFLVDIFEMELQGKCPFLHKNHCRIYNRRPLICQTFPFYIDLDGSLQVRYCPQLPNSKEGNPLARTTIPEYIQTALKYLFFEKKILQQYKNELFNHGASKIGKIPYDVSLVGLLEYKSNFKNLISQNGTKLS